MTIQNNEVNLDLFVNFCNDLLFRTLKIKLKKDNTLFNRCFVGYTSLFYEESIVSVSQYLLLKLGSL